MKIFLASPHTFLKFKDGLKLALIAMGGGIPNNEDISGREYNLSEIHRSDAIRGGFSLTQNEDISCGCDTVWSEEKYKGGGFNKVIKEHRPFILESFYYADADTERLIPYYGDFLLDSGAFTFITDKSIAHNWDEYVERYATFIKKNKVKKYFELDIDAVVGYKKVLEYREKLEKQVGWPCIPVWHKSRGIEEYKKHCQEYSYVGIGGYVIKELTPEDYNAFPAMINYAHKYDCNVHCLGYTKLSNLAKHHFDSVDSTAWTTGNRFGYVYYFNGKTMKKRDAPQGARLADSRKVALHNYTEWIKFQKWAETHL